MGTSLCGWQEDTIAIGNNFLLYDFVAVLLGLLYYELGIIAHSHLFKFMKFSNPDYTYPAYI